MASIESFRKELIERGYNVIKYNYADLIEKNHNIKLLKSLKATEISLVRVVDYTLEKRLVSAAKSLNIKICIQIKGKLRWISLLTILGFSCGKSPLPNPAQLALLVPPTGVCPTAQGLCRDHRSGDIYSRRTHVKLSS